MDESVWENAFHLKQRFRSHCGVSLEVTQGETWTGRKQSLQGTGGFGLHLLGLGCPVLRSWASAGEGQSPMEGCSWRLLLGLLNPPAPSPVLRLHRFSFLPSPGFGLSQPLQAPWPHFLSICPADLALPSLSPFHRVRGGGVGWQLPEAPTCRPAPDCSLCAPPPPTSPPPRPGAGERCGAAGAKDQGDRELCALCCDSATLPPPQEAFQTVAWLQDRVSWDLSWYCLD